MTYRITLLALDECFASNLAGTADLLRAANLVAAEVDARAEPQFSWKVVSPDGRLVRASNGLSLNVDGAARDHPPGQLIVVPAFGSPQPDHFLAVLERHRHLLPWLREQHASGVTLAASCSGSFLLAEGGLLDGRRATTSWWLGELFRSRYPAVHLELGSMLTQDERLLCSGTGMSHVDLALHIVGAHAGRAVARCVAKYAVLDDRRRSQAPFVAPHHARGHDPVVLKAERWIKAHLDRVITVEDIATQVAVSPRTLTRRFHEHVGDSPLGFVQKLRIEASKALLENTRLRIGEVVARVGYEDDRTFRRAFRKHTTLAPRDYRQRFGLDPGNRAEHETATADSRTPGKGRRETPAHSW